MSVGPGGPPRVVRQAVIEMRGDGDRAATRKQHSVAVCCRLGNRVGGDRAAGTGLVVDEHRRTDAGTELLRQVATDHILRTAGRERDDDAHRAVVALRLYRPEDESYGKRRKRMPKGSS